MEISIYEHQQWLQKYHSSTTSIFNSPEFVLKIADTYGKSLRWYVVTDNSELLFSIPIIHSKRNAELCTHFFYQAILLNQTLSEVKLLESWKLLIQQLKSDFDLIDFKFAPYVEDVRPFIWEGFEQTTRYTSVVDLSTHPKYSENVSRSIKKAIKYSLSVNRYSFNSEIVDEQIRDMMKYGLAKKHAMKFSSWFRYCSDESSAIVFELIENNERIGSSLYLMDKQSAYLIATMGGRDHSGGQAYLYDQAFQYFKELGLKEVDLLGANIPSVALYKSKLGAELKSYQMLSYRKHKLKAKILSVSKDFAKKMLKSFRIINK